MDGKITLDQSIQLIPKILSELHEQRTYLEKLLQQEAVPRLLTDTETAEILGIALSTLRKWVCTKKITVIKAGGSKFHPKDLQAFIDKNRVKGRSN